MRVVVGSRRIRISADHDPSRRPLRLSRAARLPTHGYDGYWAEHTLLRFLLATHKIVVMLSDWSAECSSDDPVLVVPWSDPSDPSGNRRFIDLRENPYDLDHLPEVEQHPPLMHALRALNAHRSAVFTAKCDAWPLEAEELDDLRATTLTQPPTTPRQASQATSTSSGASDLSSPPITRWSRACIA